MGLVMDDSSRSGSGASSEPLGSLFPVGLARRFHRWKGRSGRRYIVSVYPASSAPDYAEAVVIAVRRTPAGRHILGVAAVEPGRERPALPAEADEIHFHLLAEDPGSRRAVAEDLDGEG
jgi:hypothetical protein